MISNINFSKRDVLRNIKIPKVLTPDLAEIIGVILGDGHLDYNKKYSSTTMNVLSISGSFSEDLEYYQNRINPLFLSLFNLPLKISKHKQREDELIAKLYSKAIVNFFIKLGIRSGNKVDNNSIPEIILNSNDKIKKFFLRGVFDTDGSITFKKDTLGKHSKPVITFKMKSKGFVLSIKKILEHFEFIPTFYSENILDKRYNRFRLRYTLDLGGKKNLEKFLLLIGFNNPKHSSKIEIWRKFGFCPPNTNYPQRQEMLNGKLNPLSFY